VILRDIEKKRTSKMIAKSSDADVLTFPYGKKTTSDIWTSVQMSPSDRPTAVNVATTTVRSTPSNPTSQPVAPRRREEEGRKPLLTEDMSFDVILGWLCFEVVWPW